MREKLLKGEYLSHQPFERQRFDDLLLVEHLHTVLLSIQLQDDVVADQLRGDVIAFEINADLAIAIDGCRSTCSPSSEASQLSGSTVAGKAGKVGRMGKALRGGRLPHERP